MSQVFCKSCEKEYLVCDFCRFHCFNGVFEWRRNSWQQVYDDRGFCWITMLSVDPEDEICEYFHCSLA